MDKMILRTREALQVEFPCQGKNITAGKEVEQTLLFIIKLCEAGRLHSAQREAVNVESENIAMPEPAEESIQAIAPDDDSA